MSCDPRDTRSGYVSSSSLSHLLFVLAKVTESNRALLETREETSKTHTHPPPPTHLARLKSAEMCATAMASENRKKKLTFTTTERQAGGGEKKQKRQQREKGEGGGGGG